MKDLSELNLYRIDHIYDKDWGRKGGAFVIQYKGQILRIIASIEGGWDHVSISLEDRVPTWEEMEFVKRMFFKDDELAFQLHLPPNRHINFHPNVLHLWRDQNRKFRLPPREMV